MYLEVKAIMSVIAMIFITFEAKLIKYDHHGCAYSSPAWKTDK